MNVVVIVGFLIVFSLLAEYFIKIAWAINEKTILLCGFGHKIWIVEKLPSDVILIPTSNISRSDWNRSGLESAKTILNDNQKMPFTFPLKTTIGGPPTLPSITQIGSPPCLTSNMTLGSLVHQLNPGLLNPYACVIKIDTEGVTIRNKHLIHSWRLVKSHSYWIVYVLKIQ